MTPVRDIPWEPGLLESHRDPAAAAQLGLLSEAGLPPACQVPRLQARARDVQAQLSPREFVSLLALRAVANAPCRIGALAAAD